jgi:hypothetical protein
MATQWTAGTTSGQVLTAATLNTIGAASVSYTPTLTQGVTVSKTIVVARYFQYQKMVIGQVSLSVTSSGTSGSRILIGLPLTSNIASEIIVGTFLIVGGPSHYGNIVGSAVQQSTTTVGGFVTSGTSNWAGVSPTYQLLSGDSVHITFMYEVA